MKNLGFILPAVLIIGGFVGMALSLPATGWAVLVGILLYPYDTLNAIKSDKKDDN